jgi:hypothetical protein
MERRTRRSNRIHESLSHFLDSLCMKRNLDAVALTTNDGLLIAGKGKVDLDEVGAIGAAAQRTSTGFLGHTLHVSRFEVNDLVLCLTSIGAPVRDDAAIGSLVRILAA